MLCLERRIIVDIQAINLKSKIIWVFCIVIPRLCLIGFQVGRSAVKQGMNQKLDLKGQSPESIAFTSTEAYEMPNR